MNIFSTETKIILYLIILLGFGMTANSIQAACGDALVDSRDGKSYSTVLIGTQCWMAQNLNVGTRINGAGNQTNNSTLEKYCYSDNEANCTTYGGLYQWNEAMQYASSCNGTGAPPNDICSSPVQGICPTGWHMPSHYEFTTLERAVCTSGSCATDFPYNTSTTGERGTNEGTTLKTVDSTHFSALLGGYRYLDGLFYNSLDYASFWTSVQSGSSAWHRYLLSSDGRSIRFTREKGYGMSIRCLKNPNTAPTITSISATPTPIKGGSTITITPIGQTDADSNNLNLFCAEATAPTAGTNICTEASTSYASPYSSMTCTYASASDNTTHTVYCRTYDGTEYSNEVTTTFVTDSTAPTITITNPNTSPAQSKTITATTSDGTLTMSNTTGAVCDGTLTFTAYASQTFTTESDNTTKVCYKAIDAVGNIAYGLSNAIAGIDMTAPQTPVASTPGGQFTTARNISLSSTGSSAIYYTLNNTIPTTGSTLYAGSISIGESKTIKAIAVDTAGNQSGILAEEYIIKDAVPEGKKIEKTINLLNINSKDKKTNQPTISLPTSGLFSIKASDPDQLKRVTLKIGNKTFVLKNTNKKDKGTFAAVLDQFKDKIGKYVYTITADYGTTQIRQKGTINVTTSKNNVVLNDVNKNFREALGRTPTKTEWTKWAKEVQKGITKIELQKMLKQAK